MFNLLRNIYSLEEQKVVMRLTPTSEILRQNDALSFLFTRADNYILPPSRQILSTDVLSRRIFYSKEPFQEVSKYTPLARPIYSFTGMKRKRVNSDSQYFVPR